MDGSNGERKARDALRDERERDAFAAVPRERTTHDESERGEMCERKKSQQNVLMTEVSNDDAKLGYYSPLDGMRLHVIDTDPMSVSANGWLEDLSKVEKYVMSDEAYEKREGHLSPVGEKKKRRRPDVDVTKRTTETLRNQRKKHKRRGSRRRRRHSSGERKDVDDVFVV